MTETRQFTVTVQYGEAGVTVEAQEFDMVSGKHVGETSKVECTDRMPEDEADSEVERTAGRLVYNLMQKVPTQGA